MTGSELAKYIDHTALKATVTPAEIDRLCAEAKQHSFAAVCINPCYIKRAAAALAGTPVLVATVVGFPLGAMTPAAKAVETREAIEMGAHEVDMVINIGLAKAGDWAAVEADIRAVVQAAAETCDKAIVKVIIEACYLTDDEKAEACRRSVAAGAHYVKTSTGFGPSGATAADIKLMRATVGPMIGVKAAGGIRTTADALAMVEAGASRIGASASIALIEGLASGTV